MSKRAYYELGRKVNEIIKDKKPIAEEMEAILAALKKANDEGFNDPRKTPSINHGLNRAWGLAQDVLGAKIARGCLKRVKMLLDFEDLKVLLEQEEPKIEKRDIQRMQRSTWPQESPRMKDLLKYLEQYMNGDNKEFEWKGKVLNGGEGVLIKKQTRTTTPLAEAKLSIDKICVGAKLVFTVQMANIIATDYLERKDIKIPEGKKLFSDKEKQLDKNEDIRICQLLYDITKKVDDIVDVFVVNQDKMKMLPQGAGFKSKFKKITKLFDENARVPTKITKDTYHLVATFLHVLKRLKAAIDQDPGVKRLIGAVWKNFYVKTFDNGEKYSEDLSKNPMLVNLKHVVAEYEKGLENGHKVKVEEKANKKAVVVDDEESSSDDLEEVTIKF